MKIYNTASGNIEEFKPLKSNQVTIYACGPTVYDYTHIGHLRTYVNVDLLKRTLTYLGFKVNHVMNITDVGHLTGDDDTGTDKLETGAEKSGRSVWEVAEFYTNHFLQSIRALNIIESVKLVKATDHIQDMLQLVGVLKQKGFAYETTEAVYFDIAKFENYGKLSGQKLEDKLKGARNEVRVDPAKKHPADFALWFKTVGRFKDHIMHWQSDFGEGFPGWHIECSAMSMKYLGETIDIHAGGIDHIATHHENEIAQSEAATGKQFVKYWFHAEHLQVEGQKMSKSLNNFYTVDNLVERGIEPFALRFLFLQTHYRKQLNFTWESLNAASTGLKHLKESILDLKNKISDNSQFRNNSAHTFENRFNEALSDDLNISQALVVLYDTLRSNISAQQKYKLITKFDEVLGLNLNKIESEQIPQEIIDLAEKRQQARLQKDFAKADELRKQIESLGYNIEDAGDGYKIKRN